MAIAVGVSRTHRAQQASAMLKSGGTRQRKAVWSSAWRSVMQPAYGVKRAARTGVAPDIPRLLRLPGQVVEVHDQLVLRHEVLRLVFDRALIPPAWLRRKAQRHDLL